MSCMTIFFYKQVQIRRSDIRPHIKWAVSLVILHMVTSIFLQGLCGYIWVNILTLSPRRGIIWIWECKLTQGIEMTDQTQRTLLSRFSHIILETMSFQAVCNFVKDTECFACITAHPYNSTNHQGLNPWPLDRGQYISYPETLALNTEPSGTSKRFIAKTLKFIHACLM